MIGLKGTFLLGLGAQKAGSSWARDYFAQDPIADFGPIKEYHVWDVLHLPHTKQFDHRKRNPLRSRAEDALRHVLGKGPDIAGIRSSLQASHNAYFNFFEGLLDHDGITLTGDITPLYAGLPGSVLAQIREGFTERDIDVRVLFLMRDPVNRCISAAQMNRRKGDLEEGVPTEGTLDDAVLAYVLSPQERLRADYRRTVETLRDTFPEDALYFGFYETMFGAEAVTALSRFVGVETKPELAVRRVNSFAKSEDVSDATHAKLREILEPDYDYCLSAFPEIKPHWTKQKKN